MSANTIRLWFRDPLFYFHIAGLGLLGAVLYAYHLEQVPLSGRTRFNLISSHWEAQLGKQLLEEELSKQAENVYAQTSEQHQTVQRVFARIVPHSGLATEAWDVHVVEDDDRQAYVLPGGQVFVTSGMLDLCSSDDELAVILGHEVAHNVMHHSSEKLSQSLYLMPAVLVGCLLSGIEPDLVDFAVDVAFRFPPLRAQEEEADHFGLLITARSGYDPSAALTLWCRWNEEEDPLTVPQYMRTHPTHQSRLQQIASRLRDVNRKRILVKSPDDGFLEAFYLQRTFCGPPRSSVHFSGS